MPLVGGPMEHRRLRTVVSLSLAIVTGVVLLAVQAPGNLIWAVAFGVAALPALLVSRSRTLLWIILAAVYFGDWLSSDLGLLPTQVGWLIELCAVVLLFRLLGRPERLFAPRLLPLWLYTVAVLAPASAALVAGQSPLVLMVGLRAYLRFPLVGMALAASDDPLDSRETWMALLLVAAVQLPVALYQLGTVGPGDLASGTFGFGGTGIEAVYLCCVTAVLIASRSLENYSWPARLASGALLFAPTVIGSAVVSYLLLPLGLVMVIVSDESQVLGLTMRIAAVSAATLCIALVGFAASRDLGYMDASALLSSPQSILKYDQQVSNAGQLGRLDKARTAVSLSFAGSSIQTVLGWGPGMASPSALGPSFEGPLYRSPVISKLDPSFDTGLLELGWLGTSLSLSAFLSAFIVCIHTLRRNSQTFKPLLQLALVSSAFMVICSPYAGIWIQPGTAALFWVTYAVSTRPARLPGPNEQPEGERA